ncbi:hypothetical protein RFI_16416 [Reticulomyxa filosa]|uniref:Uncharacterized protein n=1 Tax=Reticulomyxa filosa TaxID=46433 RepID=X6N4W6_RETFI|nr:hypothetical protein RFI_16416 [Reticulomyxa filosa]|eukprot:ETO20799.1 hypothetical protein RFI_16416 [Reticulomyxa filosa]
MFRNLKKFNFYTFKRLIKNIFCFQVRKYTCFLLYVQFLHKLFYNSNNRTVISYICEILAFKTCNQIGPKDKKRDANVTMTCQFFCKNNNHVYFCPYAFCQAFDKREASSGWFLCISAESSAQHMNSATTADRMTNITAQHKNNPIKNPSTAVPQPSSLGMPSIDFDIKKPIIAVTIAPITAPQDKANPVYFCYFWKMDLF